MNNKVIMAAAQVNKLPYEHGDHAFSCGDECREIKTHYPLSSSVKRQHSMHFRDYILRKCDLCERRMRRYFGLDTGEVGVFANSMPACVTALQTIDRILTIQLTNLLYDTYIRLLISGHQQVIVMHPSPVLSCLKQALAKFDQAIQSSITTDPDYAEFVQRRRQIDLGSLQDVGRVFDHLTLMFDFTRKNGAMLSLDLLLPEYIEKLVCQVDELPFSDNRAVIAADVNSGGLAANWLSIFQTLYIPDIDNLLIDHRHHREQVYIPVYRFGDDAVAAMSMSSYIGNTMRRNIRQLYDFIDTLLTDLHCQSPVCPCVIIFNMFVRDYFRVYHSKSLPQTSFIQIYDSKNGNSIKISYMLIANRFPKISQWFNSINNQFVKKTGYARVIHIDNYVRLISRSCEAVLASFKKQLTKKMKKNRHKKTVKKTLTGTHKTSRSLAGKDKKNRHCRSVRWGLSLQDTAPRDAGVGPESRKSDSKRKEKITLSRLFDAGRGDLRPVFCRSQAGVDSGTDRLADNHDGTLILAGLYRSGFSACQHRHVVRVYTQKRSHDENASLSIFCNDCYCYL